MDLPPDDPRRAPRRGTVGRSHLPDLRLLSNLLNLYMHDLSDTFPIEVGADGRFRYAKLPLYWSEPEKRFPFLIYSGTQLAVFTFAARRTPR